VGWKGVEESGVAGLAITQSTQLTMSNDSVTELPESGKFEDALTGILRDDARRLLHVAVEAEPDGFPGSIGAAVPARAAGRWSAAAIIRSGPSAPGSVGALAYVADTEGSAKTGTEVNATHIAGFRQRAASPVCGFCPIVNSGNGSGPVRKSRVFRGTRATHWPPCPCVCPPGSVRGAAPPGSFCGGQQPLVGGGVRESRTRLHRAHPRPFSIHVSRPAETRPDRLRATA